MPGSGKAQQENILASRQSKVSMIFDIRYSTFGGKQHCEYQNGSIFGVSSGGGGGGATGVLQNRRKLIRMYFFGIKMSFPRKLTLS